MWPVQMSQRFPMLWSSDRSWDFEWLVEIDGSHSSLHISLHASNWRLATKKWRYRAIHEVGWSNSAHSAASRRSSRRTWPVPHGYHKITSKKYSVSAIFTTSSSMCPLVFDAWSHWNYNRLKKASKYLRVTAARVMNHPLQFQVCISAIRLKGSRRLRHHTSAICPKIQMYLLCYSWRLLVIS